MPYYTLLSSRIDQSLPYLAPEPSNFCNRSTRHDHACTNCPVEFSDSSLDQSKLPSIDVKLVRDDEEYQ